jgi:hypothetical protein
LVNLGVNGNFCQLRIPWSRGRTSSPVEPGARRRAPWMSGPADRPSGQTRTVPRNPGLGNERERIELLTPRARPRLPPARSGSARSRPLPLAELGRCSRATLGPFPARRSGTLRSAASRESTSPAPEAQLTERDLAGVNYLMLGDQRTSASAQRSRLRRQPKSSANAAAASRFAGIAARSASTA